MNREQNETALADMLSVFRGYAWLGSPVPLMLFCTGYLTPGWQMPLLLVIAAAFVVVVYLLCLQYHRIRKYLRSRRDWRKRAGWKRVGTMVLLLLSGISMFGIAIDPQLPLYVRGICASGFYLLYILSQYKKLR